MHPQDQPSLNLVRDHLEQALRALEDLSKISAPEGVGASGTVADGEDDE